VDPGFWNERFRGERYAYGTEPNDFLRAHAARIPPGRVLCLAEGEGRNATFLAGRGHLVTAVDFSAEGLRKAARLAGERGVTIDLVEADLAIYEPEADAYAGVVSIFCHLAPPLRRRLHGAVARALVPGGVFLLEAYTPRQLAFGTGGPRDPALLVEPEELGAEVAALAVEHLVEVVREIHEGTAHAGRSATVQLIAARRS
jgi:SAM-dependent methyltransferase